MFEDTKTCIQKPQIEDEQTIRNKKTEIYAKIRKHDKENYYSDKNDPIKNQTEVASKR